MTQTDFGGSQFPDDEDRNGPQNVGLLAIQPSDVAASPRIFYWMFVLITVDGRITLNYITRKYTV